MRIILVRHGEPNYAQDCLTALGHAQAEAAAQRLRGEGIQTIYSSPMGRAMETAQAASDLLGIGPIQVLDWMHELDWGSDSDQPIFADGHPWDIASEMARTGWDLSRPDWDEHPFFRHNVVTENVRLIERKADEWLQSLGYAREGVYYRCMREHPADTTIALFCHGGSSAALLSRILALPFPYICGSFHLSFTAVTILRLDWEEGGKSLPRLELVNDDAHIRGIELPETIAPLMTHQGKTTD